MTVALCQVELQDMQSTASLQENVFIYGYSRRKRPPGVPVFHLTPNAVKTAGGSGRGAGMLT